MKTKRFYFPVLSVVFVAYCLIRGPPNNWLLWGFLSCILDLLWNPIYVSREEETK